MAKNNEIAVQQRNNSTALMTRPEEERFATPFADVYETPEAFVLMLDMPGANKDTININVDRAVLTVRGPVANLHKQNASLLYNEIPGVDFYRAFHLGEEISQDNVDAHFENGVLTIKLFKKEEVKPKQIHIR